MENIDAEFEYLLKELMSNVKTYQMTEKEYRYISSFVGSKNFLVFGTGYDTKFWEYSNRNGKTVFLEHDEKWIPEDKDNVFKVTYTCNMLDWKILLQDFKNQIYKNLEIFLPNKILEIKWDVILIDSPPGYSTEQYGRMQSIFTGRKLSNRDTDVFVHDCDREIEKKYTEEMFGQLIFETKKLRHVKL